MVHPEDARITLDQMRRLELRIEASFTVEMLSDLGACADEAANYGPMSEEGGSPRRMATWAIAALAIAVIVMVLGMGSALFPAQGDAAASAAPAPGAAGLVDGNTTATNGTQPIGTQWSVWGAPTFRLGFSFVIAYLAAYAVRFVLKTAMIGAGMAVLLLVGLQAAGIIDVHWAVLESKGGTAAAWMKEQTESLHAFLTGYLPSAGAAGLGMFAGLRGKGV